MKSKVYFLSTVLAIFLVNLVKDSIDPYYYTILIYIGINIILASSLNLINGFTGQFSLGHAGFMAIGGYLSISISTYFAPFFNNLFGTGAFGENITFVVVMILGGLAAALIGLLVGVPSLRLKGDYLAIVTLGFSENYTRTYSGYGFYRCFTGVSRGISVQQWCKEFTDAR